MWRFDYSAHAAFVAPAAEKAQVWRTVVGLVLIIGTLAGLGPLIYTVIFEIFNQRISDRGVAIVFAMLFSFVTATLGVFGALYFVHDRLAATVFGPWQTVIDHFTKVSVGIITLLVVVAVLPPWGYGGPLIANQAFGPWLMVLPIALVAVFVQSSAEEILFRGYLQQQLGARFRSPWVWMVVPSVLFAFAHYDPQTAGENAWLIVIWAGLFGVAMADLTARAGNLGPAIAIHFINNAMALLVVALPDQLGGAALYLLPFGLSDVDAMRTWMPVDFVTTFVMWLIARLAIRR
jgi:membrane protease YdiL (CAAX protease family)